MRTKIRKSYYINSEVALRVTELAKLQPNRKLSEGVVAESLIRKGLGNDPDANKLADMLKNLPILVSYVKDLRRDNEILLEVLSHFIFNWLCYTPAPPESDAKSALSAQGRERLKSFFATLSKQLKKGNYVNFLKNFDVPGGD